MESRKLSIGAVSAFTLLLTVGCGQSQQQSDVPKTENPEIASTPPQSGTPPASSSSNTTQPTQEPAQKPAPKPAATKPATTNT